MLASNVHVFRSESEAQTQLLPSLCTQAYEPGPRRRPLEDLVISRYTRNLLPQELRDDISNRVRAPFDFPTELLKTLKSRTASGVGGAQHAVTLEYIREHTLRATTALITDDPSISLDLRVRLVGVLPAIINVLDLDIITLLSKATLTDEQFQEYTLVALHQAPVQGIIITSHLAVKLGTSAIMLRFQEHLRLLIVAKPWLSPSVETYLAKATNLTVLALAIGGESPWSRLHHVLLNLRLLVSRVELDLSIDARKAKIAQPVEVFSRWAPLFEMDCPTTLRRLSMLVEPAQESFLNSLAVQIRGDATFATSVLQPDYRLGAIATNLPILSLFLSQNHANSPMSPFLGCPVTEIHVDASTVEQAIRNLPNYVYARRTHLTVRFPYRVEAQDPRVQDLIRHFWRKGIRLVPTSWEEKPLAFPLNPFSYVSISFTSFGNRL